MKLRLRVFHKDFLQKASRQRDVQMAMDFVEVLPTEVVDRRTYNMLASVCVHASDLENALLTAERMQQRGFQLDLPMYTNLITGTQSWSHS